MTEKQIQVTACDNELHIFAISSSRRQSTEILSYKSGRGEPVDITINLSTVLNPGSYTLAMAGINYSQEINFEVAVTSDNQNPKQFNTSTNPPVNQYFWNAVYEINVG